MCASARRARVRVRVAGGVSCGTNSATPRSAPRVEPAPAAETHSHGSRMARGRSIGPNPFEAEYVEMQYDAFQPTFCSSPFATVGVSARTPKPSFEVASIQTHPQGACFRIHVAPRSCAADSRGGAHGPPWKRAYLREKSRVRYTDARARECDVLRASSIPSRSGGIGDSERKNSTPLARVSESRGGRAHETKCA